MSDEYIPGVSDAPEQREYSYGGYGSLIDDPVNTPGTESNKKEKSARTTSVGLEQLFPETDAFKYIATNIGETFEKPLMPRDSFLNLLSRWETGIPLSNLWAVIFKIPNKVTTSTMHKWGEYVGADPGSEYTGEGGGPNLARKYLGFGENGFTDKFGHGALGCMLAQTIGLPVEQSAISTVGPSNRGFLKGPIMEQRQTFAPINIEFLETNVSFLEFILRPWAIMCQHEGLVARNWGSEPGLVDPNERVTTDMTVINYGKTGSSSVKGGGGYKSTTGLIPRKIWVFTDCFPVNIGRERYANEGVSSPDRRDTEWSFRKYQAILPEQYINVMKEHDPEVKAEKFWTQHKKDFKSSRKASGGFFGLFG